MRRRKIIVALLLLSLVLGGATACNPLGSTQTETSQQQVSVTRGDLTVSVTGSGNIAASREATLSFGSGGKVDKIYVKEGDTVSKGDVLAKLDTTTLEVALIQAQVTLTQAKLAMTQAILAQKTAENNLKNAIDSQDTLELALLNAQIDLRTAEHDLDETRDLYTWPEIRTAQADVDKAKAYVEYVEASGFSAETLEYAKARLTAAEETLDAMIHSYDTEEVAIAKMEVEAAEMSATQAQKNLDKLADDVTIKELQLESAVESANETGQSVTLAQYSVNEAQKQLDEATIIAPFDGIIATVSAKEGDTVPSPTLAPKTIIYLVDPGTMDLIVELDEIDIPQVKLGQEAIISLDALPDVNFKGKVTAIFPVPTEVGGVVLYNVKVNFDVPEEPEPKIGMSASADIITSKRSDVLLVPSRAITEDSQGKPIVKVLVNGEIQERQVVEGISDDLQAEIVSGLSEGETIIVETRVRPQSSDLGFF